MAVGIRPNTALAKDAGLEVNRGIVTDHMVTSTPTFFRSANASRSAVMSMAWSRRSMKWRR
jgi:NADPH-dependent 2,4-dienoyl-CoA reductase/sulfur reductase-like enzyme